MQAVLRGLLVSAGLAAPAQADELSPFVENVLTHVLLHEVAHALIREFDIPVLANEENMADSFATAFITSQFDPDISAPMIMDRVISWFYEAAQDDEPRLQGEHEPDIRRAYRTLCMLYGTSPADYAHLTEPYPFSNRDLADCGEIAEQKEAAWDRVLTPFLADAPSPNVEVAYGDVYLAEATRNSGVMEDVADIARRYDWPEKITFALRDCGDGTGAWWSRSEKTITLCDSYVDRFQSQDFAINQ